MPRRDVYEVRERLRHDGSVDTPFDESSLAPVIEAVREDGIEAVAVCLVHAYVNPEHELRAREVLERECPGLSVTLSHEIAREIEDQLEYPGQVKVIVIRESRSIEIAH